MTATVLILVVMEDSIWRRNSEIEAAKAFLVLILVVMEDSIWHQEGLPTISNKEMS